MKVDDIPIHLLCHLPLVGLCATHEAPELPCIFGIEQVEVGLGPVGLNFDLVGLLLQILGELYRVLRKINFEWGPCLVVVG